MKKYEYYFDDNQIDIIEKFNDIRKNNNISKLYYYKRNNLPNFIINKKTEIIFFPDRYIYELSTNLYIIKFNKNDFLNIITKKEIINKITIDLLDKINIIEQDNFYFISIYKNKVNNLPINTISKRIELPNINSSDKLNYNYINKCDVYKYDKEN